MIHGTQRAQISQKENWRNINAIMKIWLYIYHKVVCPMYFISNEFGEKRQIYIKDTFILLILKVPANERKLVSVAHC